jgi:DinB family protein
VGITQDALVVRFTESSSVLDFTVADLTQEQLHSIADGATLGSPASIYFHVLWVEDLVVNQMLRGVDTVYDGQGWLEKLPTAQPHRGPSTFEWARSIQIDDLSVANAYAATVRANTIDYIQGLSDEDLEREVVFFDGPTKQVNVLFWLTWNIANHTGEIAALRGLSGLKGLPF